MTTSEFIVCELLGCGLLDIEELFGKLTETDYFSNAVEDCKMRGVGVSAGAGSGKVQFTRLSVMFSVMMSNSTRTSISLIPMFP